MSFEQFAAAFTEPCTTIDGDTAAGMVDAGFHVYAIDADTLVTKDVAFRDIDKPFSFEEHTFAAPRNELWQYREVENLCEKLDSLNDDIRADSGVSLEDYADELFDNEESTFMWRSALSEWENIRAGILSGETKFLHDFLNDYAYGSELIEELDHYFFHIFLRNSIFAVRVLNDLPENEIGKCLRIYMILHDSSAIYISRSAHFPRLNNNYKPNRRLCQ